MENKHVIFMGTPQIAATVLENLLTCDVIVDLVVTQPDKKIGRKQTIQYSPVKELALEHGIEVFQPVKIKQEFEFLYNYQPDLIVTCAYGQIVPKEVLDLPKQGCVNLHGSLLPKYRGGAPIQRAIWDGLTVSGMTLMKMDVKMDAGAIYKQLEIPILPEDNMTSMFEKMGDGAGELLKANIESLLDGSACFVEQDESQVTYAPIITKAEEHIDFNQDDAHIVNQIRALSQQPGAYVIVKKKKLKILEASYEKKAVQECGTFEAVGKKNMDMHLHEGVLHIQSCQMEGKPVMAISDFMNGQGRSLVGQIAE